MNSRRTGLFGGTFDPVHNGHLFTALEAACEYNLERVWFIPSFTPPHKEYSPVAGAADRLRMLELAAAESPIFSVSDAELERKGMSYTIDTVREFRRNSPHCGEIYFITGFDSYLDFGSWKDSSALLEECRFITAPRSPGDRERMSLGLITGFLPLYSPVLEISSTEIRMRVEAAKPVSYLLPAPVENYIKDHGLYSK